MLTPTPVWELDPDLDFTATVDGTTIGATPTLGGRAFTTPWGTTATVETVGEHRVLRGGPVDGSGGDAAAAHFSSAITGTLPVSVAMVIDINPLAAQYTYAARIKYGAYQGVVVQSYGGEMQMWNPDSTYYVIPAGRHVLLVVDDVTSERMYLDGNLLEDSVWGSARTQAAVLLTFWGDVYRAAAWSTALTPAQVAVVSSDLSTAYSGQVALTASTTVVFTAATEVTTTVAAPAVTPPATPGGSVTPPVPPEPQLPGAGVGDPVIRRVSEIMPAPPVDGAGNWNLDTNGIPASWEPTTVVDVEFARVQVVVEGVDITYLWDTPLPFPTWTRTEPFGSAAATISIPQITPFHVLPTWCAPGANVDILLVRTTGTVVSRFAGVVTTFGHHADAGVFRLECSGVLFADDLQLRQPAFLTAPRDIGAVVADVLNSSISRRHTDLTPKVTGCMTGVLGGWEPKLTGYVAELLATAVTGGRQWTVACSVRAPVLVLKDTTTIGWTVSNGQRGITVDLTQDWSKAPNVLFGSGIGPDGGRWQNAKYPNWRPDSTPAYPNTNPSQTIKVGTTDAGTDTGAGVSDWQRRVGLNPTGQFGQVERARAFGVQAAAGIQQDGIVGPQTWAATFGTGSNTGTLECFYAPLAFSTTVMPRLFGPDGDDLGANPAYDPDVLRVEDKIDSGQGVSKAEGTRSAKEILARDIHPGWTGSVTFEIDPEQGSRYDVMEGSNGQIRGFRGTDLVVHTASVDYTEAAVIATVDTNARDYPELRAVRERERNATDPAKSLVKRLTSGSVGVDRATFDAESPAGRIPRHALFANLWTVVRIPFGAYGSVVRTEVTTSGSVRPFSLGVFDRPITAAQLLALMGNPMSATENPWSAHADALTAAGLLMSWGWAKQPGGYYPQELTSPDGTTTSPVTGRLLDDSSWEYASSQVPWLWVAEIASGSCYIEGRFWPGADG